MTELSLRVPSPAALRPPKLCSDAQLARRAARGDQRAFAEIFERHHQAVYRYCRSILGNSEDAADALQNTMSAVLRGLEGETREIALKSWIFRIAHNEALSIVRRRRPETELDETHACPRESLESDVLASEQLRQLVSDVQSLPERQRGVLVMRELNDLGYDEIAAAFGMSEGAARQAIYEARAALHDLAQGRALPCDEVRELISARDGRMLRSRKLRAHLRACEPCEGFRAAIGERRVALGIAAPPLAAPFAASMLAGLIGGGGGGAAAGATAAGAAAAVPVAGSMAVSGAIAAPAVTATAVKAVAVLAAAATLTGGAVAVEHRVSSDDRARAGNERSSSATQARLQSTRAASAAATAASRRGGPAAGAAGVGNSSQAAVRGRGAKQRAAAATPGAKRSRAARAAAAKAKAARAAAKVRRAKGRATAASATASKGKSGASSAVGKAKQPTARTQQRPAEAKSKAPVTRPDAKQQSQGLKEPKAPQPRSGG